MDYTDLVEQVQVMRELVGVCIGSAADEHEYAMLITVEDLLMVVEQGLTNYLVREREKLHGDDIG